MSKKNATSGFQQTPIGLIPKDWKLEELKHKALILFSNVDKHIRETEREVFLCNYTDVYYNRYIFRSIPFSKGTVTSLEFKKFRIKKGDVIITKDSEDRRDIAVSSYVLENITNLVCSYHLAIIRPIRNELDGLFLSNLFQTPQINRQFQKLANGITRYGLNKESIKKSLIPIPPVNEQQKIAEILSSWDLSISICKELIQSLKARNIGLAQQLLTGKKRLKGFEEIWVTVTLGECARNVSIRNEGVLGSEKLYAVTKKQGMVPMREQVKGASFTNCKIVRPRWFAYNPMRLNIGSIAMWSGDDEVMVSGDYVVFECNIKRLLPNYLEYLRKTIIWENFMLVAGNGSVRIRIYFNELGKLKFRIPSIEEQQAIINILQEADQELTLYNEKLASLEEQKRGLMQKLLTGQLRVKVN